MTHQERLEFCSICTNRKMNWEQGLLCGLTDQKASFEGSCESFVKDEAEEEYVLKQKLAMTGDNTVGDPIDFEKNKRNGAIIFWIGLIITFMSLMYFEQNGFAIIPSGALLFGAIQYFRGVEQEKVFNEAERKKQQH